MNRMRLINSALPLLAAAVIGSLTTAAPAQPAPDGPGPQDLRQNRDEPGGWRAELTGELEKLKAHLAELRANGQAVRERMVRRRIQELENELGGGPRALVTPQAEGWTPPPPERPPPGQAPGLPRAERRLYHLRVAIRNLHAAGLHDAAQAIARRAEEIRQQLQRGPGLEAPGPGGPPIMGELRQMREQIQDLRQTVHELRRRLDEMNPERR